MPDNKDLNFLEIERLLDEVSRLPESEQDLHLSALEAKSKQTANLLRSLASRQTGEFGFMQTHDASDGSTRENILAPGTQIGRWKVDEFIGSGGMGEVYKAHRGDELYEQSVALKLVSAENSARLARFDEERRQLARLDHSGIARIIDGGVSDEGRAFLVMELVRGSPIDAHVQSADLTLSQRLKLIQHLCEAVAHAHSRLIIHRDIKPANVLIDENGDVRLIDFGVAAWMHENDLSGGPMTFAYASPEQLRGDAIGVESDVFTLGMLMCEVVTGQLPTRRPDGGVIIPDVAVLDRELTEILKRATAFSRDNRYGFATELFDDLGRYLNNEPVSVLTNSGVYRLRKRLQRHPVSAALSLGLLVALVGGLGVSLYATDRAQEARLEAENALMRERVATATEAAFSETLQSLFQSDLKSNELGALMQTRATEAHQISATAPDSAAQTIFAIGRSFVFRGDYRQAVSVLEPWLNEGYGPEHIRWQGTVDLAVAYQALKDWEKALPLLREAEKYFAEFSDVPTYETVLIANQIAKNTLDEDDSRSAIHFAREALELDPTDSERLYYYSALLSSYRRLSDDDNGYEIALKAFEFLEGQPLHDRHRGLDIRFFLADLSLYVKGNPEQARRAIQPLVEREDLGSFPAAMANSFLANSLAEIGSFEKAKAHAAIALQHAEDATGKTSGFYTTTLADQIDVDLLSGDTESARERIANVKAERAGADSQYSMNYWIAEAHFLTATGENEAALALLAEHDISPATATQSYRRFRIDRLRDLGLDVDRLNAAIDE